MLEGLSDEEVAAKLRSLVEDHDDTVGHHAEHIAAILAELAAAIEEAKARGIKVGGCQLECRASILKPQLEPIGEVVITRSIKL